MKESELQRENRLLRGLVQTNEKWRCPYGAVPKGKTMAHCTLGFPGCSCADDRLAGLLPEEERQVVDALRKEVEGLRALVAELRAHNRAHFLVAAADNMPGDITAELRTTLNHCPCPTCKRIRTATGESIKVAEALIEAMAGHKIPFK